MSARALPLPPPPRSPAVHEGLGVGQHFHGDYYAASQVGGTAGGHGNTNTTFNGGEGEYTQLTSPAYSSSPIDIDSDAYLLILYCRDD